MPAPDLLPLERELADHWSRDQLAVYGDHLQSLGDPRNKLIAIASPALPGEAAVPKAPRSRSI